jgi:hypothetical protein
MMLASERTFTIMMNLRVRRDLCCQVLRVVVAIVFSCGLHEIANCQTWEYVGGPGGVYSNDILFTASGRLISSIDKGISLSDDFGDTWRGVMVDPTLGVIHAMTERACKTIIAIFLPGLMAAACGDGHFQI